MFGTARSNQTATDSYLTEMLRAMLEIILGIDRVYVTQVRIRYERPIMIPQGLRGNYRWAATASRKVDVNAYLVSGDSEKTLIRHTVEAKIDLDRVNFDPWEIAFASLRVDSHDGTDRRGDFYFHSDHGQWTPFLREITPQLRVLDRLLSFIRPTDDAEE